jgi:hypothetical protein
VPFSYSGLISRYLDPNKQSFSGMKSHDCHVMMTTSVAYRRVVQKSCTPRVQTYPRRTGSVYAMNIDRWATHPIKWPAPPVSIRGVHTSSTPRVCPHPMRTASLYATDADKWGLPLASFSAPPPFDPQKTTSRASSPSSPIYLAVPSSLIPRRPFLSVTSPPSSLSAAKLPPLPLEVIGRHRKLSPAQATRSRRPPGAVRPLAATSPVHAPARRKLPLPQATAAASSRRPVGELPLSPSQFNI